MDVVGVAQECLHTIKARKLQDFILKMDLIKAYDQVDWSFFRLVLLQIGIPIDVTNSIMACTTSTNFAILINDTPTSFF